MVVCSGVGGKGRLVLAAASGLLGITRPVHGEHGGRALRGEHGAGDVGGRLHGIRRLPSGE